MNKIYSGPIEFLSNHSNAIHSIVRGKNVCILNEQMEWVEYMGSYLELSNSQKHMHTHTHT